MPNFLLLATAWGPKFGGINSFNTDFAGGLSFHLKGTGEVFCAVLSCSEEDKQDAKLKKVNLFSIGRQADSSAYDKSWALDVWTEFARQFPNQKIDWWVGHDVITGEAAVNGPVVANSGRSALIMHMNYADYKTIQAKTSDLAHQKEKQQRSLFSKADRAFANGPLLLGALREIAPSASMLVPGFAPVPSEPSTQRVRAITFGRMDRESDRIKQGSLAVAAFGSAVKLAGSDKNCPEGLRSNPQIRVIGISESGGEEERRLKVLVDERADREVNLFALQYDHDRAVLYEELGRANIALMLSWHEGFGLAGWEAVAGEVPLIISRQSGLWELIRNTLTQRIAEAYVRVIDVRGLRAEEGGENFRPEDEAAVRDAIIELARNPEDARTAAIKLKQELQNKLICTWENTAKEFLSGLGSGEDQVTKPQQTEKPIIHSVTGAQPMLGDFREPVSAEFFTSLRKTSPAHATPIVASRPASESDFISIPRPNLPEAATFKGVGMPDSLLLRPENGIVPFHSLRSRMRDELLQWALDLTRPITLRLQAGEGGSGKTRLLIQICKELEAEHGWRAGFLGRLKSISEGLPSLLKERKPCLIVLDYAENRASEIVELVRIYLSTQDPPPVRIALSAREGGDWWEHLSDAAGSDQAIAAILRGATTKTGPYRMATETIDVDLRASFFQDAVSAFAASKDVPITEGSCPDLSSPIFGNPLFIHLAALAALRGLSPTKDEELLDTVLSHERSYWRQLLADVSCGADLLPAFEQAVALLTLCGGRRSAKEAKEVISSAPLLRGIEPPIRQQIFQILRALYPLEGGVAGLMPDVLGERLVSKVLGQDDELLDVVFGQWSDSEDARTALTILTRLASRVPAEERWISRALNRYLVPLCLDALRVGREAGAPMPELLTHAIKSAAPEERQRAVMKLRNSLEVASSELSNLTLEVRHGFVQVLEKKRSGNPSKRVKNLVEALLSLCDELRRAKRFSEAVIFSKEALGRVLADHVQEESKLTARVFEAHAIALSGVAQFEEGLAKSEQAEALWRALAKKQPDTYRADWARSLANLASCLRDVGRFDEGLAKAEQVEALRRGLAEKRPDTDSADWARSLGSLANLLSDVCRFDEGLAKAEQAEALFRALAEKQPDTYNANWALSLTGLASHLRFVSRFEEGLAKAEQAEALLRALAEKQPDTYRADWATSLVNLANQLRDVGRFEEGLAKAEQSEVLWRALAAAQPDAYSSEWATSLNNLAGQLREVGRLEEGLAKSEQAEALRRKLAEAQPDAYSAEWASSLGNLAGHLRDVSRFEEALAKAEQAEAIRHALAEKQPDAYGGDWAMSLGNLASHLSDVGRFEEGLAKAEQAEALRRTLAEKQPDAYSADWARSLGNLASHFCDVGRFDEGLTKAEQSETLWRVLEAQQPDAYRADWARSLGNLAIILRDIGHFEEGLAKEQQSEVLWRALAEKQPDAYRTDWAVSLGDLANLLRDIGRFEEGLAKAEQSEVLWRALAEKQSDAYGVNWGVSLTILAECRILLRTFREALKDAERSIGIIRKWATDYPRRYLGLLADATRVGSDALIGLGRFQEALKAVHEALFFWRTELAYRPGHEPTPIALTFCARARCELALGDNDAAIATVGEALETLVFHVRENPHAAASALSKLIEITLPVDPVAVSNLIPTELRKYLSIGSSPSENAPSE